MISWIFPANHCLPGSTPGPMMLRPHKVSALVARLVAPRHRKEFSADVSRCTPNTQMLRCGSRTVGQAFDRQACAAEVEQPAETRLGRHRRVRRASSFCICAEILALRCCRPVVTEGSRGLRHATESWRNRTVARRAVWRSGLAAAVGLRCDTFAYIRMPPPQPGQPSIRTPPVSFP